MFSKWTRRGVLLFAGYLIVHLIVTLVDNNWVVDRTDVHRKQFNGPLISKTATKKDISRSSSGNISITDHGDPLLHPVQPATYPLPVISDLFLENFKVEAKEIYLKSNDFLLFTLVNGAYLNLTLNWLCNVAQFSSAVHRKSLIVSLDAEACPVIQNSWKGTKCIHLNVPEHYNDPLKWGRQAYINLLTIRSQLLLILVQLKIPYILFETDAVWLRDPFEFFQNQTTIDDADIIVPVKGYPDRGQSYSFDPMVVYPTNASLALMREMYSQLSNNPKLYDQDVLDQLCQQQYFGVVCRQFEWNEVADGKWFKLSEAERAHLRPYIINNNYYIGVDNKTSRQALSGFWFLTPKRKCNFSKVQSVLSKYKS